MEFCDRDIFKYLFNSQDFPSEWFVDGWDQCYFERRSLNEYKHYIVLDNGRVLYSVIVNRK